MKKDEFLVVGSVNMDFLLVVDGFPKPGEAAIASVLRTHPGGKGANQALALARLGVPVRIIGRVGKDNFGFFIKEFLWKNEVRTSTLRAVKGCKTGLAFVVVDRAGQNFVTVFAGANSTLSPKDIEKEEEAFKTAWAVLLQLEIRMETNIAAAKKAKENGAVVFLDSAPFRGPLPEDIIPIVDYIFFTAYEESMIRSGREYLRNMARRGPRIVVLDLCRGATLIRGDEEINVPACPMKIVDPTGARDAFVAAFAVSLHEGKSEEEALWVANVSASISASREGAAESVPSRDDLEKALEMCGGERVVQNPQEKEGC